LWQEVVPLSQGAAGDMVVTDMEKNSDEKLIRLNCPADKFEKKNETLLHLFKLHLEC